ncbi:MAG TPA: signal recognition particle protein [Thermomicrobiales bacterium]|jgi:signal recognition particle subunit SRP54|nr:signal recognition particle protein [Thermomicrobiales bacterium]
MFETLSDRLNETFGRLGRGGRLTEKDIDDAMRDVRRALLEADVNFKVTKDFVAAVKERAQGQDVLSSLTPGQTVISIVNEELIKVLGEEQVPLLTPDRPPQIIMMVGLQGSGKTTHSGKLAVHLRKAGRNPLLVAADVQRPAAVQQLQTLGRQVDVPVYEEGTNNTPVKIAQNALRFAQERGYNPVIIDTAGRLQIDEPLMQELVDIKNAVNPTEILLVADAMTGQEAVGVAETFHERLGVTGLILTKMDGDARGGAALSIRAVTGVPIKFIGTGEKLDALEPFYPDRLAGRILGMGDVLSLIERAQEQTDEDEAERMQDRMLKGQFDLEDFLDQLQKVKKMGPLSQLIEMIPGIGQQLRQANAQITDDDYKQVEAIIRGMTPWERRHPEQITHSRRRRIAAGSGVDRAEVNRLLTQFKEMQKMMSQFGSMAKGGGIPGMPGGKGGRGKKGKRGQRGMKGMPNLPFDF